ncbi:Transcriptional regulator, contains XRE-family HTH domain [Clostridium amylolyticum]|uniref:Transcriptional regulator, contains XRE-family HTH domain n=1 Tax=Clostridium amylolyticum TaxID=1121298 RepID=A0A1M6F0W9_9CLOT|nr:helix-turn-helix transcriptional regulator [Clostridium amylolyticum]SHI91291.1 Transcriptional regulator, contains XRE-family HTH domain [Clostridium amylolyticum]
MIGKNIRKLRQSRKLTLSALANKISVSVGYLSDIEKGNKTNPSLEFLTKLADALEVPLDYLTRKSAKALIEDRLEELDMNFEKLSDETKIPLIFFEKLDDIIPDEGDYNQIQKIARTLNMEPSILAEALYRQQPPIYEGISLNSEDGFRVEENTVTYGSDDKIHDPEDAMAFLIKQPSLAAYGGYDPKTMSDEEIVEFANELLRQLKLLGFKYKK